MKTLRWFCALAAVLLAGSAKAQPPQPKPGPEHEVLKAMEGNWDLAMKVEGMETKGTVTYKMDLGGLWLTGALETEFFGTKFQGKSLDGYDATRKKYVGVWVDSMSNSPMLLEGTYDKEKKALTMTGEGPGPDGKPTKHKMVTTYTDKDTMNFSMYMGDTKDPMLTIVYKRKK
jgi:hypothetical protein